ncbi:kelch repeat and BTB domain-containing protein 3-like [Phlebotomus papatasi]|uniref:kelch repeat and BTB domain-containing protein 3-like n=1 Tax=Phlebotomus papatasi TaxID=29031 RepID=UPI002483FD5B|nr:kelch repeat and BTB domain-containing protein 3-like [Phlebotomus papatasi]
MEVNSTFWSGNECIEERLSKFICNEFLSDMIFVVGKEKKRVPGHKFILSSCSWQFYNAFNLLKLDKDELPVEDVSYESFLGFLSYCYTGKVFLDDKSTLEILKLAHRFQIDHLVKLCTDYLYLNTTDKTCMMIFSRCLSITEDSVLINKVLDIIAYHFSSIIQDESSMKIFRNLPFDALQKITERMDLRCNEMELFDALMKWAIHNCLKIKIVPEPKNLRRILRHIFYRIPFSSMQMKWIFEILAKYPEILTPKEILDISSSLANGEKSQSEKNSRKKTTIFSIKSIKVDIPKEQQLVSCFTNELQIKDDCLSEMSVKFTSSIRRGFVGYAFIAKTGQAIAEISCKLERLDLYVPYVYNRNVKIEKRHKISWDYELVIVRLQEMVMILPNYTHQLHCKFDAKLPHIVSKPNKILEIFHFNNSKEIFIEIDDCNLIPYLIFRQPFL